MNLLLLQASLEGQVWDLQDLLPRASDVEARRMRIRIRRLARLRDLVVAARLRRGS